jgi:type I restriction enzyme S subunit
MNGTNKSVSDKWRSVKIGAIAKVVSGGTPDTNNDLYWGGEYNWITPTEITKAGKYIAEETEKKITESGLKNSSTVLIPKGSLILCSRATIGECAINLYSIATNQGFKNLLPGKDISVEFLYYRIKALKRELLKISSGSTFLEFSKKDIEKLRFDLPPFCEQNRIVGILNAWDKAIEKLGRKIELKKKIKRGLMERLLAGETPFG